MRRVTARTLLLALCTTLAVASIKAQSSVRPETVMLTLQPRHGAEDDLAKALADHWSTAQRLDLVAPDPHVTLRARDEAGRPYFVEIFTLARRGDSRQRTGGDHGNLGADERADRNA